MPVCQDCEKEFIGPSWKAYCLKCHLILTGRTPNLCHCGNVITDFKKKHCYECHMKLVNYRRN